MKTKGCLCAFALAAIAFADISGSASVQNGAGFAFDSGTYTTSGDIFFTGTSITWQGGAKGVVIPGRDPASLNQQLLQQLATSFPTIPILASSLLPGSVIALQTQGGNVAKLQVSSITSNAFQFLYLTYGSAPVVGANVTRVLNNSSLILNGFPNSGVAPSTIIQIQGSNLSDPVQGTLALEDSTKGLPTTLRGASSRVTSGGKDYPIAWYYTSPTQVAGVLPAGVPTGPATLTYTFKGASTTSTITIVPAAFGIDVYDGKYAVLQDSITGAIITPTNSAKPGQTLTLWGTGLGADQGLSDTTANSTQQKINTPIQLFIGSMQVPPSSIRYVGSLYYPGVNGIVFDVPPNIGSGCFLSISVVANVNNSFVTSNVAAASFMPNGGVCEDFYTGLDGHSASTLNSGASTNSGFVSIFQASVQSRDGSSSVDTRAFATFQQSNGGSAFNDSASTTSVGSCSLTQSLAGANGTSSSMNGLNPGSITVTPPADQPFLLGRFSQVPGAYIGSISAIPPDGGSYSINATGANGPNTVGTFTTTVTFSSPLLSWINQAQNATVTRSQGQTYNWTGGTPGSFVIMSGSSTSTSGRVTGSYTCIAPVEAKTFTLPTYIMSALPAGNGTSSIENSTRFQKFTAAGLDFGAAIGGVSFQIDSVYQ